MIKKEFSKLLNNNHSTSFVQEEKSINSMDQVINQKWYARITLVIAKEFIITIEALIDSGADLNCVSEGIIPTKYFTKTTQTLNTANGGRMPIQYKLSDVAVCLEGGCFQTSFLLSKDMARLAI